MQWSQHQLSKRLFFLPLNQPGTLVQNQSTVMWGVSPAPLPGAHGSMPIAHGPECLQTCRHFWNWEVWVLQFCSAFSKFFWLFWVPCISIRVLESAYWFLQKEGSRMLIAVTTILSISLGRTAVLAMFSPPIHGCGISFHSSRPPLISFNHVL